MNAAESELEEKEDEILIVNQQKVEVIEKVAEKKIQKKIQLSDAIQ